MRTYDRFIVEAEGFQGKMTPGHNARDGAITLNNKLNKKTPSKPGALAVRPPGGRGVGTTQSSYKTGPLAKRAADKGGALVRSKNYKEPNNDEKKTASRPGSTRDGWGVKPTGDFRDPGNAAHDKAKKMSDYDKARKKRDIENKLDAEDKKKGRFGKFVKDARKGTNDMVKNALKNNVKDVDSVEGKEGSSAGRMQKQY